MTAERRRQIELRERHETGGICATCDLLAELRAVEAERDAAVKALETIESSPHQTNLALRSIARAARAGEP